MKNKKELKPQAGAGYDALIPYNEYTKQLIKILRKGLTPGMQLIVRGARVKDGMKRSSSFGISLKEASAVRLYLRYKGATHDSNTPTYTCITKEELLQQEEHEQKQVNMLNRLSIELTERENEIDNLDTRLDVAYARAHELEKQLTLARKEITDEREAGRQTLQKLLIIESVVRL